MMPKRLRRKHSETIYLNAPTFTGQGGSSEGIKAVIEEYSDKVEGNYNKIYIRNQKTKWGSCSGKNNLSFNFRLIMAPPEVLEYVVVHELLHLEKPEHSKAFWRKLANLLPDYQESKEWLKENKMKLVLREEDVF